MKFLQVLITSLFAFLFTRAVGAVVGPEGGDAKRATGPEPRRVMVRCSSCGVYVLRERALPGANSAYVCSASCAGARSRA